MFVFVYGTLKKGEPNHHWLTNVDEGKATFHCKGKTSQLYPLVIASKYNIPFLLDKAGTGKNIEGEVYEIDEKMLAYLDVLEEYPKLYTRREEEIIPLETENKSTEHVSSNSKIVKAWTYFLSDFQPDLLERPFLNEYSALGPHNLPYFAKYVRDKSFDHRPQVKISVPS